MPAVRQRLKGAVIELACLAGLPRLLAPSFGGVGAIIGMHRVRTASTEPFQPNRALEVTPDFLDRTLSQIRASGFEIVGLDDMERRLADRVFDKRFVCLTLDDGYRDNVEHAYPVFKAHEAPFSIYATTGFLDGTAFLWWMLLEEVIRSHQEVTLRIERDTDRRPTATLREKQAAFDAWHTRFRALGEDAVEMASRHLCQDYGIDPCDFHITQAMTWDMARAITADGLGTIEAHTDRHIALSLQTPEVITAEMARTRERIAEQTGRQPRHFAYPFGDSRAVTARDVHLLMDLPVATATTTRAGVLRRDHRHALTALPRLELNGHYQSKGYVDLALSGLTSTLSRV